MRHHNFLGPATTQTITDKILVCQCCEETNATVKVRICAYDLELFDSVRWELVCDSCEYEHRMDV